MQADKGQIDQEESPQEKLGRLAFAYCKIATVSLLLGRYALPTAAALSAGLFIAAWHKGKKDTKCKIGHPLLAAGFWIVILTIWLAMQFFPAYVPGWLKAIHP